MTYDSVEPIGGPRGDWQAAMIAATTMNAAAFLRTGKIALPFKAKDFLLVFRDHTAADDAVAPAAAPAPTTTEGRKEPAAPWQAMKMAARMHVALANSAKDVDRAGFRKQRKR